MGEFFFKKLQVNFRNAPDGPRNRKTNRPREACKFIPNHGNPKKKNRPVMSWREDDDLKIRLACGFPKFPRVSNRDNRIPIVGDNTCLRRIERWRKAQRINIKQLFFENFPNSRILRQAPRYELFLVVRDGFDAMRV